MLIETTVSTTGSSDHLLRRELGRIDRLLALVSRGEASLTTPAARLAATLSSLAAEHDGASAPLSPTDATCVLPGLARMARVYGLSAFDRDLLLLAAAPEIDQRYADALQSVLGAAGASLGALMNLVIRGYGLPRDVALSRSAADAPLLRYALLRPLGDAQASPQRCPVVVPDPVWRRIVGIDGGADFELAPRHTLEALVLTDETKAAFERALMWARKQAKGVVIVHGPAGSGRLALASALADALKRRALQVGAQFDPRVVVREARWLGALPVFGSVPATRPSAHELGRIAEEVGIVLVVAETARIASDLPVFDLPAVRPGRDERLRLWSRALGTGDDEASSPALASVVDRRLGPGQVLAVARRVRERIARPSELAREDLVRACRLLNEEEPAGAERIEPRFTLDDLVLPAATRRELELAVAWGRQLEQLATRPSAHLSSGRGLSCLFYGPPGTGKTSAAQVLAHELGLELYRIDLSQVVDKYIGETEKHLARLFEVAEQHNFVLLFDEADALFGRRTEVRDAHDRYANVETSYLLQRLEQHAGVTVLATNLRSNLDPAFVRRLHVVAEFPLPSVPERRALWERLVPSPRAADLDFSWLASRFALSGGDIRNAVLAALVLARSEPVAMRHLVVGVWREQSRAGRLLDQQAFEPWHGELAHWLGQRG